jgi:polar amino acid transport system substrate-binding protein
VNEFLGYRKIQELGLDEKVVPFERPMSTETLHMIISKRHWRGTTLMYRFNAGLENLKKSQRYEEIVSRHLGIFWGN